METNESEPFEDVSKILRCHQNRGGLPTSGQVWKEPAYCPGGDRYTGGVNLAQALIRNLGTCPSMLRESHKWRTHEGDNTDAKEQGRDSS